MDDDGTRSDGSGRTCGDWPRGSYIRQVPPASPPEATEMPTYKVSLPENAAGVSAAKDLNISIANWMEEQTELGAVTAITNVILESPGALSDCSK